MSSAGASIRSGARSEGRQLGREHEAETGAIYRYGDVSFCRYFGEIQFAQLAHGENREHGAA